MQGTPSCLTCPPPKSQQPCSSDSEPRDSKTVAMTHIANLIDAHKYSLYISHETSSRMSVSDQVHSSIQMNCPQPRRSCSLKDLQQAKDTTTKASSASLAKSPSLANLSQPTSATSSSTSRFQLWPSSRSPVGLSDKLSALSVGRSATSLSDTAVLPESVPFWQRSSSLARRRKVSVPELGQTMTTVQEMAIDSRKPPCLTVLA